MNHCGKFLKQSIMNFRRFQIFGFPWSPRDIVCLIFVIIKTLLYSKGTLSQILQAIGKDILDF